MNKRTVAIRHISPLSAAKTALALSLAGLVAWLICVVVVYFGLDVAGIWDKANEVIAGVGGERILSFGVIISFAGLIGGILTLMCTVLAPLLAVIYNAVVDVFGGLVVTLDAAEQ